MFILKYFFITLLLLNSVAFTQSTVANSLLSEQSNFNQRDIRIQIAKDISKYIKALDSAVPDIKSIDRDRIIKELSETEITSDFHKLSTIY